MGKEALEFKWKKIQTILLIWVAMSIAGCINPKPEAKLLVKTSGVSEIVYQSCKAEGELIDLSKDGVIQHGFCLAVNKEPTISDLLLELGPADSKGQFSRYITTLNTNTEYQIRAFARNSQETVYGDVETFSTLEVSTPTLTTATVINASMNSAQSGGTITDDGGAEISARGVCWDTLKIPTIEDPHTIDEGGSGNFTSMLTGLQCGKNYNVRAYASNSAGTAYGNKISFRMTDCSASLPEIITTVAADISVYQAIIGGEIKSDGGSVIIERGFFYGQSDSPQSSGTKIIAVGEENIFTQTITGLTNATLYYFVAYATNLEGTTFGDVLDFTTLQSISKPVLATTGSSLITSSSATIEGNISSDGGATVMENGFYYSTSNTPQSGGTKVQAGAGTGTFSAEISELISGTLYYFIAYATNSVGTAYGNILSLTTTTPELPRLSTAEVSNITKTSAQCGGSITNDGGAAIISKGVCWNTTPEPTLANESLDQGGGLEDFTCSLESLSPSTTYYVKAYATNSAGTSYGKQKVFVTDKSCLEEMVSYWKFQESSGPQYYDSYGSNQADAASNWPTATKGISGNGQDFSPSSSAYLRIPDNGDFDWNTNDDYSIELWVKYSPTSGVQVFMARDEPSNLMQWWIGSNVTGRISWFSQSSDGDNSLVQSPGSYGDYQWHHVVAVRDGGSSLNYLYVDGVLMNPGGTSAVMGGNLYSQEPLTMGALLYNGNPDYMYSGVLDEVAIFDRTLDQTEDIIPHYNNLKSFQIGYCGSDFPSIFSTPVQEAQLGMQYSYDVDASGNSLPSYELVQSPTGMSINSSTGQITWTPSSVTQNGHVIVRATNDKGSTQQEFQIFIADSPLCRSDLVAYWNFNEPPGSSYHDNIWNYELSGTNSGSIPGIVGTALVFNGLSDSLNMEDDFSPGSAFFDFPKGSEWSMEVWFKSTATPDQIMIVLGRDDDVTQTQYWLGINTDGSAGFFLRDWPSSSSSKYLSGGSNLLDGEWHHLVASHHNADQSMELFVDGYNVDAATMTFEGFTGDSELNIGFMNTGAQYYWFEGQLDELAFYDQQLTPSRVLENYYSGMSGTGACTSNHAPVIISEPETSTMQDAPYSYLLMVEDIDAQDIISISAPTLPPWMSLMYTAGEKTATIYGTPTNDDIGIASIVVRASDGKINIDQAYSLEVININDPPIFTSTPVTTVSAGSSYTYSIVASDADDDDLSYSFPVLPGWLSWDLGSSILIGTPASTDIGMNDVSISVSDGTLDVSQDFIITVESGNKASQDIEYSNLLIESDSLTNFHITVFPNPAWNSIEFRFSELVPDALFKIWNESSSLVKQQLIHESKQVTVDISDFNPGVFHYMISIDDQYFRGSFIKIKN